MACGYLALDSDDFPHIVYVTSLPRDQSGWGYLAYASKINNNWDTQTINSTFISGNWFLAEDQNDDAHITFVGVVPDGSQTYNSIGPYSWSAPIMYAKYVRPSSALKTPIPSPTVPELPWWVAMPFLLMTLIALFAVIKRKPPVLAGRFKMSAIEPLVFVLKFFRSPKLSSKICFKDQHLISCCEF